MKLLLPLISALPSVLAQYYGSSDSSTSASVAVAAASATASSSSSMQTIMVGNGGFKFSPDTLTVKPGNSVVFQFYPGGHSAVQSSFDKPCAPLNDSSFSSGTVNSDSGPAVSWKTRIVVFRFVSLTLRSRKSLLFLLIVPIPFGSTALK
jgi:plastocyanin